MAYGILKVDNITFDNGGSDQNVTVSGLYRATTSGVTVSGTIAATTVSGVTIIGSTTVSGATVTGTTANFTSGNFSNIISSAATMSGSLIMANQQQVRFREAVGNGVNHIALQAPAIVSADQTITLPDQTGTVITTGDNGSVSSTMLATNLTISAAAGSASTPSIAFTGDLNTGIYSPGADQLALTTGGTGRLFVDASGRVGIGTGSPRGLVSIANNAAGTGVVDSSLHLGYSISDYYGHRIVNSNEPASTAAGLLRFQRGTTAAWVDTVTIDTFGRVGIGTSSPDSALYVVAGSVARLRIGFNDTSFNYYDADTQIFRAVDGTERVRIDSAGRVGIGTSSPIANLVVQSDSTNTSFNAPYFNYAAIVRNDNLTNNNFVAVSFNTKNTSGSDTTLASIAAQCTNHTTGAVNGTLAFYTEGGSGVTERMRIASDGNVLFNTTSNPLPTNAIGVLNILSDGAATRDVINIKHAKNGNNSINIWQTGATSFRALSFYKGDVQTDVGSIVCTTTATAYNTSSDYRIKENVVPLINAIDRLNNLQVHRFNFVADPNLTVDGFIAHEAQAVVPECVTGTKDAVDDDDNPIYQGIDQSKLVPLLTAALQEAIARIETLEAAVAALQSA